LEVIIKMESEKYTKWLPLEDIPDRLYIDGLYDDREGFRLLLSDYETGRMLRITFDPVLSYRNTDEGDLLVTLESREGFIKWPLFTIENSKFIHWFNEESLNIHKDENPVHYSIYTPNDIIDVISTSPPIVEWLPDMNKGVRDDKWS
jgi:hypothetical protein